MRKNLIYIFCLLLLACSDNSNDSTESNADLSTDEKVLEELNKGRTDKNKINKDDICIERPEKFKDLILIGYFAHDRGCMGNEVFYKGNRSTIDKVTAEVLMDAGWKDKVQREAIAIQYVVKVLLQWEIPLETEPENFKSNGDYTFMPPTAITENSETTVSVWTREPPGMAREDYFYLFTVTFGKNGEIVKSQVTDRFTVSYEFD